MAELSLWSAQALQYPAKDSSAKVIYFDNREELQTVLKSITQSLAASDGNEMFPPTFKISYTAPTTGGFDGDLAARWRELGDALGINSKPEESKKADQYYKFDDLYYFELENFMKEKPDRKKGDQGGGKGDKIEEGNKKGGKEEDDKKADKKERDKKEGKKKEGDKKGGEEKDKKKNIISNSEDHLPWRLRLWNAIFKRKITAFDSTDPSIGSTNFPGDIDKIRNLYATEFDGAFPPNSNNYYKYALVFDLTTEFNPSGIWIIQDSEESNY